MDDNLFYRAADYWRQPDAGLPGGAWNPINSFGLGMGAVRNGMENGDMVEAGLGALSMAGGGANAAGALSMGAKYAPKIGLAAKQGVKALDKALLPQVPTLRQAMATPRPATAPVMHQNAVQAQQARSFIRGGQPGGYIKEDHMNPSLLAQMTSNAGRAVADVFKPHTSLRGLTPGNAGIGIRG
jgi:hypothetical protein